MLLPNILIQIIGAAAVIFFAFYGLRSGSLALQVGVVAAPVVFFLVNNPSLWMIVIIGLVQSKLIIPGLPQGLHLVHVMMAGFAFMMLARNCIVKTSGPRANTSDYFLYGFLVVLVITAAHRGIGIRALGGDQWGGMGYIKLMISAGFLITSRYVILSPKQVRSAIFLMIGLSLLPLGAQMLFMLSGGRVYHQYMFVEAYVPGLMGSLEAAESGSGVVRINAVSGLAFSLLMATFTLIRPVGFKRGAIVIAAVLAVGLSSLSGFRGQILSITGTLSLFAIFSSRSARWPRLLLVLGAALMALLLIYPLLPYLPAAVQRAFSFLPGANIPVDVLLDAQFSSRWRIQLWELAWREVPDYLWIGKGFTFHPNEMMSLSVLRDTVMHAFVGHNYHSGPLTLLLDLGIPGLITGSGFLIFSAIEVARGVDRITTDPILERFYRFTTSFYVYSVPAFFLIFGDVRETFPSLFAWLAMLKVVQQSNANELASARKKALEAAQAADPAATPARRRVVFH